MKKKLSDFSSTHQFFDYISKNLSEGTNVKYTGELFEQFTREWHLNFGDYTAIYDANDLASIPHNIVDKIDAFEILSKGANSFGIDKICVSRLNGEIDIHQDKSTIHVDKKLSTDKAAKMMSLRNNPLKGIRNYIINTTAKDLSHYSKLWKDQPPVTYSFSDFIPVTEDDIKRDLVFWQNIKAKSKKKPTVNVYGFISRGPEQDDYINNITSYIKKSLFDNGYAKCHGIGVGALGKSVLDAIITVKIDSDLAIFDSPPVSVAFYHSSKTLPKNGRELVMRRRAAGIFNEEVIVVSGTDVINGESINSLNTSFTKTTSASEATAKILAALERGNRVLLLALYHHAEQIADIKKLLSSKYPNFKYQFRLRDECDWPSRNPYSRYAAALDDRTDSIVTFGSSGTEIYGKDPINDYGMNNINIHGPCVHRFTWAQAEDAGLIKPLVLVIPCIKESEVAAIFPEFVDDNGRVDWRLRVNGKQVDDTYPTVESLGLLIALAKTLVQYPEIKRLLIFSNFVKNNKLLQANWKYICNKILSTSLLAASVKKMFWQVLNDEEYNSTSIKDHTLAIKEAKKHDRYALASCRLLNRGYDDVPPPNFKGTWLRHHAGMHFDPCNIVDFAQGTWRYTRLDPNDSSPAYCICPQIHNDLSDEPSFSESRLSQIQAILMLNKNIAIEFESLRKSPNGSKRQKRYSSNSRIWIPEDFDPGTFSDLVTWVTVSSKGKILDSLILTAHNWITEEYLKISAVDAVNTRVSGSIQKRFLSMKEFQPIFDAYPMARGSCKDEFVRAFIKGVYMIRRRKDFSPDTIESIQKNVLELELHKQKNIAHRNMLINAARKDAHVQISKMVSYIRKQIDRKSIADKYGFSEEAVGKIVISPVLKEFDNKIWVSNQRKVYDALIAVADKSTGLEEWAENTVQHLKKELPTLTDLFVKRYFVRSDTYNVLSKIEMEQFKEVEKEVKRKQYSKVAFEKASRQSDSDKKKIAKKRKKTLIQKQGNLTTCTNGKPVKTPWGNFKSAGEAMRHPNCQVKYGRKLRENIKNKVTGYSYI